MRPLRPVALVVAVVLALAACGGKDLRQRELMGEVPPSLDGTAVTWLNTDALSLASLRGKVVYLEFGFHG
jgi:hypothetical protein